MARKQVVPFEGWRNRYLKAQRRIRALEAENVILEVGREKREVALAAYIARAEKAEKLLAELEAEGTLKRRKHG